MRFVDIIEKKRNGTELTKEEIRFFITGVTNKTIPEYQISAFLMTIYFQGMTNAETTELTMAMAESGDQFDLSSIKGKKADKHSTGGVGDKTTLILGPLVAAVGCKVAKLSGRGLGHTGGTLDKLESYPGFKIEVSQADFIKQVNEINLAIIGQSGNVTPADKTLYALRDVTMTVDSIPLIASSVMSKKIAAGSDVIVLDIKVGDGAFMKTIEDATELATIMVNIGKTLGRGMAAFITNMDEPLGFKIGNALEIEEVIETLKNNGPEDLTHVSVELASYMVLHADGATTIEEARSKVLEVLENGKALEKFYEFITCQGGNVNEPLKIAEHKITVYPDAEGYVAKIKAEEVGVAAMHLGAGRATKEDQIDHSVGIELCAKVGDKVSKEQPLAYIYSNGTAEETAKAYILDAYQIVDSLQEKPILIHKIIE